MLRIDQSHEGASPVIVRATGQLVGPWVDELRRTLADQKTGAVVVLDLVDVGFADTSGLALLRSLRSQDRICLRCSAFVAAQLS
jgi:ABC-type transporter Mla MlaB component